MMHQVLHDKLKADAERLSEALEHMSKLFLAPKEQKTLRTFTSAEVGELLRVSDGYLRKAHFDGRIPEVEQGLGNKRLYSAENILEIRSILSQNAKDPFQFLPGRRPGDKLQIWSTVNFKGGSSKNNYDRDTRHEARFAWLSCVSCRRGSSSLADHFLWIPA